MTRRKPVGKSRTARGATTPPTRSRVQASPHTASPHTASPHTASPHAVPLHTVPPSDAPPTPTPDALILSPETPHGHEEERRQEERLLRGTPAAAIGRDDPLHPSTDGAALAPTAQLHALMEGLRDSLAADTVSDPPSDPPSEDALTESLTDPEALALACEGAIRVEDAPWAPPRVRNQLPARVIRFTIRHALCWDGTWWQHGDVWPLDLVLSCDERKLRQLVETGFLHVEVLHRGVPPALLAPPTEDD
jgi:hypothetical protein